MLDKPLEIIETPEALSAMVDVLASEPIIGVDTEADGFHHYQEKVCLIQISSLDKDYIVDTLAVRDMSALARLFANPAQVKVLHGADYDIVSLRRDFGLHFVNLFDTMIAAQFLGMPRVGLADLTGEWFGVHMDKALQRHDWSERPLQPEHLEYARGDTQWLPALYEHFCRLLTRLGRLGNVQEECRILANREWQGRTRDPSDFLRVKGARQLDEASQRVLRAVYTYRDHAAEELDRPAFKVIPEEVLLHIARSKPTDMTALTALFRKGSPLARRHGPGLLDAVAAGLADTAPIPTAPPASRAAPHAQITGRKAELLFLHLKEWRNARVDGSGMAPVTIASNTLLKAITRTGPRTLDELARVPEIRSWQLETFADEILTITNEILKDEPEAKAGGEKKRRRKKKKAPVESE